MKKYVKVTLLIFLILLLISGIYYLIILFKPNWKFSPVNIKTGLTTHTYKQNQEFRYSVYSLNINSEFRENDTTSVLCDSKSTHEFNYVLIKNCDPNYKGITLGIKVRNDSKYIQPFNQDWFNIISDRGKTYSLSDQAMDFREGDLMPNDSREATVWSIQVEKGEKEFNVIISLPDLAPQIVKIKSN